MSLLNILWNIFYRGIILSQVWISFAAPALAYQFCTAINYEIPFQYLYSLFFATLAVYNFYILISSFGNSYSTLKNNWTIYLAISIGIIGLFYNYQGWVHLYPYLGIPIMATIIYFIPRLSFPWAKNIRKWVIAKPILLAMVWILLTGIIPVLPMQITEELILFWILRWILLMDICLLFDIRDRSFDRTQGYSDWFSEILERRFLLIRRIGQMVYGTVIFILIWTAPNDWERLISWIIPVIFLWGIPVPARMEGREIYFSVGLDGLLGLGGAWDWIRNN